MMDDLIRRAKEIRDEVRIGRNTASRVGGLLVDIIGQLGTGSGDTVFTVLDGIPESEFDNVTEPGYYTYSLQDGTGEIKGMLVVSDNGDIRQVRYEFGGTYTRSRTDEGWEEWNDQFVYKLRKHIDNNTIYWDGDNQVIKAKGGITETVSIKITINPANVGQCTISATGDTINVVESDDKSSYYITATKTGTVTITIVPKDGYQVSKLNVDAVSQGAVSEYIFENLASDHTMYIWMEEMLVQTDTDFLIRSDKPSVYYSGLGECIAAIKEDYPDKLTKDIMISCVKKATEVRGSQWNSTYGIWTSTLTDWNKDSLYTLTINGNGLYTINCKWLGGLLFENVDNVFIKGISMLNYCNFSGQYTPEELSAIMFRGIDDSKVKNVILYNCKFNGYYANSSGTQAHTWYCLRFKNVANIVLGSCNLEKSGAVAVLMKGIESAEISRSYLQADYYYNEAGVGHSNILSISGDNAHLKLADNIIDGVGMIEYACSISGVSEFDFLRNTIKNCSGQAFSISKTVQKFNITSNLFHSNITNGQYAYTRRIFGCAEIKELNVKNNTVYFNGEFSSSQEFLSGRFDKLINCNNIFINKLNKAYVAFLNNGSGVKEYIAYNNIYASPFYNDNPSERFTRFSLIEVEVNGGEYLDFSFETRKLAEYQSRGYETDSVALSNKDSILNIDEGGSDYKLLESLKNTYLSNKEYAPEFDIDYLRASVNNVSPGAYNLFGEEWDETTDTSVGYEGANTIDQDTFNSSAAYIVPTDDLIIIKVNSKNRNLFIKSLFTSDNGHSFIRFGQIVTAFLQCTYNEETGMYVEDNNYTLNIKEENYE